MTSLPRATALAPLLADSSWTTWPQVVSTALASRAGDLEAALRARDLGLVDSLKVAWFAQLNGVLDELTAFDDAVRRVLAQDLVLLQALSVSLEASPLQRQLFATRLAEVATTLTRLAAQAVATKRVVKDALKTHDAVFMHSAAQERPLKLRLIQAPFGTSETAQPSQMRTLVAQAAALLAAAAPYRAELATLLDAAESQLSALQDPHAAAGAAPSATGAKELAIAARLSTYRDHLTERTTHHFGYPYNLDFDFTPLQEFLSFSINNLGDPFEASNYAVHSREFELEVLYFFADLYCIPRDQFWGYVTNCGTEGNLHGIFVGREILPEGVLYASRESHYSVFKAAKFYRMKAEMVTTHNDGCIDLDDLRVAIQRNIDKPVILNLNIGTTVKGAVDSLAGALALLKELNIPREKFYIHCDGALFALMLPFVEDAPEVNFKFDIDSISVSGHKFLGACMPCGILITRKSHIKLVEQRIEYLNSRDTTIMGSRNGHAPLFLWHSLQLKGRDGLREDTLACLQNSKLLVEKLQAAGIGLLRNQLSSTVVFERPEEAFVQRWQLACVGTIAHAIVMPSTTLEKIVRFVEELLISRAAEPDGGRKCIRPHVGSHCCQCAPCRELVSSGQATEDPSVVSGPSLVGP